MNNRKPPLEDERDALLAEQRELRELVHREFPLMTHGVAMDRANRLAAIDARLQGIDRLMRLHHPK